MGAQRNSLVKRVGVDTSDPDQAHEFFNRVYTGLTIRSFHDRQRCRFHAQGAVCAGFSVHHVTWSARLRSRAEPLGALYVMRVTDGELGLAARQRQMALRAGEIALIDPHCAIENHFNGVRASAAGIDLSVVRQAAEAAGADPDRLRFPLSRPVSAGLARYWWAVMSHVTRDVLANPTAATSSLAIAEAARLLATSTLVTFPNPTLNTPHHPDRATAPRQIRQALEFIDTHAGEAITDIAAAAGIGPRALQIVFRHHLDTTPTSYLRARRLAGARHDLRAADPTTGAAVAAIAARWGFTPPRPLRRPLPHPSTDTPHTTPSNRNHRRDLFVPPS